MQKEQFLPFDRGTIPLAYCTLMESGLTLLQSLFLGTIDHIIIIILCTSMCLNIIKLKMYYVISVIICM